MSYRWESSKWKILDSITLTSTWIIWQLSKRSLCTKNSLRVQALIIKEPLVLSMKSLNKWLKFRGKGELVLPKRLLYSRKFLKLSQYNSLRKDRSEKKLKKNKRLSYKMMMQVFWANWQSKYWTTIRKTTLLQIKTTSRKRSLCSSPTWFQAPILYKSQRKMKSLSSHQ